jgi:hypothetical protein
MNNKLYASKLVYEKLKEKYGGELCNNELLIYGISVYKIESLTNDKCFVVKPVRYKDTFEPYIPQYKPIAKNSFGFRPTVGEYEEYTTNGMKLEYGNHIIFFYKKIKAPAIVEIIIRRLYIHFILGIKSTLKPNRFKKPNMHGMINICS